MRRLLLLGLCAAPLAAHADAADLMAITNPALNDTRPTLRVGATGFAADDFTPAHRIADTWREPPDPRPGRNLAVGFARLEASQSWNNWTIGAYKRVDAFGEGNRDTVRVYYDQQSNPDALLAQPGTRNLDYHFKGFSADGLRLAWSQPASAGPLRFGAAINLLKAGFLRIENVTGRAVSAGGVATINGRRELLYTGLDYTDPSRADLNDFAPLARQSSSEGWGYALDLGMQWAPRDDLRLRAAVNDLFGRLSWQNVPQMVQNFNDASWPLQFNAPAAQAKITGTNSYRDYTLQLKPKAAVAAEWTRADWTFGASVAAMRGLILPEASVAWGHIDSGRLALSYEPRFKSVGAAIHYGPFFASLRTDRSNLNDARAVGATAGLALRF